MPPPPYPYIRDQLRRGRVIPFLGAGASFGARNPGDVPWRKAIKPELNEWDVCYLPTAKELAECLADLAQFPADETRELTKVAQYFGAVIGRPTTAAETSRDIPTTPRPGANPSLSGGSRRQRSFADCDD
jgi:hypothetical protein